MNHSPWTQNSLKLRGIQELLKQKTIKTECGKRASLAIADPNKPVDCSQCLAAIAERNQAFRRLGIK